MNRNAHHHRSHLSRSAVFIWAALALSLLAGCGAEGDGSVGSEALAQEVGAGVSTERAATDSGPATMIDVTDTAIRVDTVQPGAVSQGVEASRRTALVRAAERVAPAVVSVNVRKQEQVRPQSFFDQFFLPPGASRESVGYGSGIIFRPDGYVLTNDHVVRGAQEIRVTLPDGRDLAAKLIGTDGVTDVAVVKIEEENLPVAPLGTSVGLMIGEWTMAIGNPFAYLLSNSEPTVTAGVVSAVGRHIIPSDQEQGFYLGMIQTDASINPGNSGGPLVNALGEVIGINTSIFSRSGGSEGLGFAIPIDRALRVARDLMQYGEVRRAWTGLNVEPVDADVWGRTHGVRVSSVAPGSPAAEAGISEGDRLVRANGRDLASPLDFEAVLLDLRAGDVVEVQADGRSRPYELVTQTLPSARAQRVEVLQDLEVVTVTPEIRAEQGLSSDSGALVAGISSELSRSLGLREGDVLLQINNDRIRSAEDAARALRDLRPGSRVRIYFERNGALTYLDFLTRR